MSDHINPCGPRRGTGQRAHAALRPWIGVRFVCAGVYVRVHRRADGSGYLVRCPRCGYSTTFRVGADGVPNRVFEASCG